MYIRRDNPTIDRGDHLSMDVSSRKHPHTVMLLDRADLEILHQKRYGRATVNWNGSQSMRSATIYDRKLKVMRHVAHVLLRRPRWMKIDHANGNPLDNRRSNLEKRG